MLFKIYFTIICIIASHSLYKVVEEQHSFLSPRYIYVQFQNNYPFTVLNIHISLLFLFGKIIQKVIFGPLRKIEAKNLYERILHYTILKIIIVGAVLDITNRFEMLLWAKLFSVFGFLKTYSLLANDRYEHLLSSANYRLGKHFKIIGLLFLLFLTNFFWFAFGLFLFIQHTGEPEEISPLTSHSSNIILLTFEFFVILVGVLKICVKYMIFLIDYRHNSYWPRKRTYLYLTEFVAESLILFATLIHYLHIILYGIFFTVIDLFLLLNLKEIFVNFRNNITAFQNYRKLSHLLKAVYPSVPRSLMDLGTLCTICHDEMEFGRKLHCGHVFHRTCILLWVEHQSTCPTCRSSLFQTDTEKKITSIQQVLPQVPRNDILDSINDNPHFSAELIIDTLLSSTHANDESVDNSSTEQEPYVNYSPKQQENENGLGKSEVISSSPQNYMYSDHFHITPEKRRESLERRKQLMLVHSRKMFEKNKFVDCSE